MNIEVIYSDESPYLCLEKLTIIIDDTQYEIPGYHLEFIKDKWEIEVYPEDFPKKCKTIVLQKINERMKGKCCGGCI